MSNLSSKISFNVRFLFTGTPSIQLTPVTTLTLSEQVDLVGYFKITQPDGISEQQDYVTPDVYWNGSALTVPIKTLRLGSDQKYQKGIYQIVLYADHPDYTPGEHSKTFTFDFKQVTQVISRKFDLYTPELKYVDETNYTKAGYSILSQSSSWSGISPAGNLTPSTTATFDLAIGGDYYDSSYNVAYSKTVIYQDSSNAWLSVAVGYTYSDSAKSYIPASMSTLLTYLNNLKARKDARACDDSLNALYEKAGVLYQHIRSRVCAQNTDGLKEYFEEFYRLTHNYQNVVYQNTGGVIPAYDFTTGCGGSGSATGGTLYIRPTIGATSFTVTLPAGTAITSITRTTRKGITASATTDPDYLQVVGNTITLPTGDTVQPNPFLIGGQTVGELFIIDYK